MTTYHFSTSVKATKKVIKNVKGNSSYCRGKNERCPYKKIRRSVS